MRNKKKLKKNCDSVEKVVDIDSRPDRMYLDMRNEMNKLNSTEQGGNLANDMREVGMELVYRQVTRLNQWSWYWTDGFKYATKQYQKQEDALARGVDEGWIESIPAYPKYKSEFVD